MAKSKWNYDTCLEESRKYKSRKEFSKKCRSAYRAALRNGWLDNYDWLEVERQSWEKKSCLEEARKYTSRGEFSKKCKGAYRAALRNGWLDGYDWLEKSV